MVQVISQRTFCPHQRYLHSFRSKRTAGIFSRLAQCWGKAPNFENLPPRTHGETLKTLFSWPFSPPCLATVTSWAKEICNQTPDWTTNIHTWILNKYIIIKSASLQNYNHHHHHHHHHHPHLFSSHPEHVFVLINTKASYHVFSAVFFWIWMTIVNQDSHQI